MSRVTRREWYRRVNETWPDIVPALTEEEAARAARRLYRFVKGRKFEGEVIQTSGRRYTWIRRGALYVNAEKGWKDLVHLLSHALGRDLPGPHGGDHARLERRMIKEVLRRRWLDGTLKREPNPEPAKDDIRAEKVRRAEAAVVRWERKLGRAQRALVKLRRKLRRLTKEAQVQAAPAAVAQEGA